MDRLRLLVAAVLHRGETLGVTGVAMAIVLLVSIPSSVWHHASVDQVYSGFDQNLMYMSPAAGAAGAPSVALDHVVLSAEPAQPSSINTVTTSLGALDASLAVTINHQSARGTPMRIGVWSPRTGAGYFLLFDSAGHATTETRVHGRPGRTLVGGIVVRSHPLGDYTAGVPYRVAVHISKAREIRIAVLGAGLAASDSISASDLRDLFNSVRISLTAVAESTQGSSRVTLTSYRLVLPHQAFWANRPDDRRERLALTGLLLAGAVLTGAAGITWMWQRASVRRITHMVCCSRNVARRVYARRWRVASVLLLSIVYLSGNGALFLLGGQPFDFGNEELYAYIARNYGVVHLYYLPNVVSLAGIWNGVPWSEAAFPYEPVMAYISVAIGGLNSYLFAGGGAFTIGSTSLGYLIKAVNVTFGLLDAGLIYLVLRRIDTSERWSLTAAGLFAFNPAVWFSMSVWGQTHVISLFFVLLAVLFAEWRLPTWAWIALATACLTRPQMLVFGVILGIVFVRKFPLHRNVKAVSWTIIVVFLAIAPFTLAIGASLPADIMLNAFHIQQAGGNETSLTTVSQDAYSIWPLITYLVQGSSSLERAFTPTSSVLVGSLTYQLASQLLTIAAMLVVGGTLLLRKAPVSDTGWYLPFVALGMGSFLMLLTGVVATHFLLALPFFLLCRRWLGGIAYFYIAAIWTITTLVPMFGDFGVAITNLDYPIIAPSHSGVTRLFVYLYAWDRFITLGVVANVCAVVWLAVLAFTRGASGAKLSQLV